MHTLKINPHKNKAANRLETSGKTPLRASALRSLQKRSQSSSSNKLLIPSKLTGYYFLLKAYSFSKGSLLNYISLAMKTSRQLRSESGDGSSVGRAQWAQHSSSVKLQASCHSRTDRLAPCHLILVPICTFIRETTSGTHFPDLVPMSFGRRLAPHKEQSYRFKKEIKKPLLFFPPHFN